MTTPNLNCMYCGEPTKRGRKGEHVIPEAIGGALTLNDGSVNAVCQECNNGVLSNVDRELCSRSFLSIVASQEISADLWQAWDVDHSADHLLVEARPRWHPDKTLSQLVSYPQIAFESDGPEIRGDAEEADLFGREDFQKVLVKAVRGAFDRYRAGEKRSLHLHRVRSEIIHRGYRLAPRVFTTHSISEIARKINKQSFNLRYLTAEDKNFALRGLSNLGEGRPFRRWAIKAGSHYPAISTYFDIGDSLRGLLKIGVNLIASVCEKTPVNPETFRLPIRLILGTADVTQKLLAASGFVRAADVQEIKDEGGGHSFRLLHVGSSWLVFSSFFGGRIGAAVHFSGPNREDWNTVDIVAPLGSKKWIVRPSPILKPLKATVEWQDSRKIIPTVPILNAVSGVRAEAVPRR